MPALPSRALQAASTEKSFFVVSWTLCGIALLLLGGRAYTCWKILQRVRADLHLAICTFIFGALSMVMLTIGTAHGLGQHFSNLEAQQAHLAVMYGWINLALALVAIGLGKIAIIVFILHIQGYYEPRRSAFLWFMGASTLGINVMTVILIFTQCLTVQAIWDTSIRGSCGRRELVKNFGIFQTSWSAFCDLALALYPAFLFWNIQVFSLWRKIGISVLFGLGVVAAVCAAFKASRIHFILNTKDPTYALSEIIIWHETEMWIVLIAGSIAPTTPFFKIFLRKAFGLFGLPSQES